MSNWSKPDYGRVAILTPAESEIVDLLCQGLDTPEIVKIRGSTAATVRVHYRNIRSKMRCNSLRQVVCRVLNQRIAALQSSKS